MTFTNSNRVHGRNSEILAIALFVCLAAPLSAQVRGSGSYLGLRLADIDADRAKELKLSETGGVEIAAVLQGGAAYQAGIRPGDVLLSYNGEKLLGAQQLIRLVAETPPDRRLELTYFRGGQEKRCTIKTTAPPLSGPAEMGLISALRVTDIPSTIMLWRDMVLGIESESMSDQIAQALGAKPGILIWNVASGSPADHAGLRAGDVITNLCGHAIHSPREVGITLQQFQPGKKPVLIGIVRDHKAVNLAVSVDGADR